MFVGATGPFAQSIFFALGLEKKALVATHAAAMTAHHSLKAIAFGAIGFSFGDWLPLLAGMVATGLIGTLAGAALLDRLPERWFKAAVKAILTLLALDLIRRATQG